MVSEVTQWGEFPTFQSQLLSLWQFTNWNDASRLADANSPLSRKAPFTPTNLQDFWVSTDCVLGFEGPCGGILERARHLAGSYPIHLQSLKDRDQRRSGKEHPQTISPPLIISSVSMFNQ